MIDLEPEVASSTASRCHADEVRGPQATGGRRVKVMMLTVGLGVGGTEAQIRDLATNLDRERFCCLVCALKGDGEVARQIEERGVQVQVLGGKGFLDPRLLWRLIRLVRAFRPDVIHAFLPPANVAGGLVSVLCRVPCLILSCRDLGVSKKWHYVVAERVIAGLADVVTCCSDAVRRSVGSRFGGDSRRYLTIHNGVSIERFQAQMPLDAASIGLQGDGPLIGTVCRLEEPTKGLSVLLKAMALLKKSSGNLPFRLLVVGDGPARADLQQLCIQLGLAQEVAFSGGRHDVDRILPMLSLFVLPSLSEGFGIAIVEAMAAGLPVVASAVGGIPEIVLHGKTGLLVPPGNAAALAQAVGQCMSDPQLRRSFGLKGREIARERFSLQAAVRRHEELYARYAARGAESGA